MASTPQQSRCVQVWSRAAPFLMVGVVMLITELVARGSLAGMLRYVARPGQHTVFAALLVALLLFLVHALVNRFAVACGVLLLSTAALAAVHHAKLAVLQEPLYPWDLRLLQYDFLFGRNHQGLPRSAPAGTTLSAAGAAVSSRADPGT